MPTRSALGAERAACWSAVTWVRMSLLSSMVALMANISVNGIAAPTTRWVSALAVTAASRLATPVSATSRDTTATRPRTRTGPSAATAHSSSAQDTNPMPMP